MRRSDLGRGFMAALLTLGWNTWVYGIITVLFLLISVMLVLTILIQKPQGGGLAGAFGGAGVGSGQTAFGAKTGDALTVFTIIVFAIYIILAVVLNYATKGMIAAQNKAAIEAVPASTAPPSSENPESSPTGEKPPPAPVGNEGTQPGAAPVTPPSGG
jgi:preprotein translocase subunit SecG